MIKRSDISAIGQFNKAHGIKGELNATIDIKQDFFNAYDCIIVEINGIFVPFFLNSARSKSSTTILLQLDGINSEAETKPFINKTIYCRKEDLSQFEDEYTTEDGEFADFYIGFSIYDNTNRIGEIIDIEDSTDNALFIVKKDNDHIFYVPITPDFIEYIDENKNIIYMNLPEGLITLNN